MLIRRGKRVADIIHADCFAVFIAENGNVQTLPPRRREAVERQLNFARNLHIETRVLEGDDVATSLIDFARRNHITQVYLARPRHQARISRLRRDLVQQIVELAKDMQIVIVSGGAPHKNG